jgi:hypothetical protein
MSEKTENIVTIDINTYQELIQSKAKLQIEVATLAAQVEQTKEAQTKLTQLETDLLAQKTQLDELTSKNEQFNANYSELFGKFKSSLSIEEKVSKLTDEEKALLSDFAEDWQDPKTPERAEAISRLLEKTLTGRSTPNPFTKKEGEGGEGNPNPSDKKDAGFNQAAVLDARKK